MDDLRGAFLGGLDDIRIRPALRILQVGFLVLVVRENFRIDVDALVEGRGVAGINPGRQVLIRIRRLRIVRGLPRQGAEIGDGTAAISAGPLRQALGDASDDFVFYLVLDVGGVGGFFADPRL